MLTCVLVVEGIFLQKPAVSRDLVDMQLLPLAQTCERCPGRMHIGSVLNSWLQVCPALLADLRHPVDDQSPYLRVRTTPT